MPCLRFLHRFNQTNQILRWLDDGDYIFSSIGFEGQPLSYKLYFSNIYTLSDCPQLRELSSYIDYLHHTLHSRLAKIEFLYIFILPSLILDLFSNNLLFYSMNPHLNSELQQSFSSLIFFKYSYLFWLTMKSPFFRY